MASPATHGAGGSSAAGRIRPRVLDLDEIASHVPPGT